MSDSRIRAEGGGRKPLTEQTRDIREALQGLVEDTTRGDPEPPLLWTCKSTRQLADTLCRRGYRIGRQKVSELLSERGYSLQGNRKIKAGSAHPDRDRQFRYLNRRVKRFQRYAQPVISVDTKKKELIGDFAKKGREWRPKGRPIPTDAHDFGNERVNPYGVYDPTANVGWVSVGQAIQACIAQAHSKHQAELESLLTLKFQTFKEVPVIGEGGQVTPFPGAKQPQKKVLSKTA